MGRCAPGAIVTTGRLGGFTGRRTWWQRHRGFIWHCLAACLLYVGISVQDDSSDNHYFPENLWMGDSVQIAVDSAGDKNGPGYDGNDWEVGVALQNGAVNSGFCWKVPEGVSGCPISNSILHAGSTTTYELQIPGDFAQTIGVSLVVNDDDGSGREGWLEWTPGIGLGKDPSLYAPVHLTGEGPVIVDNPASDIGSTGPDLVSQPGGQPAPDVGMGADGRVQPGFEIGGTSDWISGPGPDGAVPWIIDDGETGGGSKGSGGCSTAIPGGHHIELLFLFLLLALGLWSALLYTRRPTE